MWKLQKQLVFELQDKWFWCIKRMALFKILAIIFEILARIF